MKNDRMYAVVVGVLFIIGTVAGILSGVVTGPVRSAADYPLNVSAHQTQWIAGTLLIALMGFALAMMPVVLYPVLKRHNPVLALGAVLFRGAIEAIFYAVMVLIFLSLVSVSELYLRAGAVEAANIGTLAALLTAALSWTEMWGALVFSLGALMVYAPFYQGRLVPRWLSGWGLLGGVLYFAANLAGIFGRQHVAPSLEAGSGVLMIPLAIQEMVFAVWMIVRGFNPAPAAGGKQEK